jgi:thiamine-monophosphate kinase
MNEFDLIARLTRSLPTNDSTVVGAGDDCALIDLGIPDRWVLFKTDAVVEGVHFTKTAAPEKIGHKALARCLSDVAAMAGTPTHVLVTLALPADFDAGFVEAIYAGMNALAARHGVGIVGGETTTNPERMLIAVSVLGTVDKGKAPLRSGARAGDAIFVTGELGGALSGKHLEFEPRLSEARWLASRFSIHAMIDLSDGLAGDLRHILNASRVGAELLSDAVPISHAAKSAARAGTSPRPPLLAALSDGEDFELLFTVAPGDAVPLLDAWKKQFPELRLSCIGRIDAGSELTVRDRKGVQPLAVHGYVHFQES